MKRIIFIFTLLITGCLNLKASPVDKSVNLFTFGRPIHIRIDFYIASRRSGCESDIGICRGEIGGRPLTGSRAANAECYIEDDVLVMMIQREKMDSNLEKEIEKLSYFPMNDEFEMPREWLDEMKISNSYTIPIGEYKIIDMSDYFLINFNLR